MNPITRFLLLVTLLLLTFVAHAQVSCPPGMMSYSTGQNLSACGPIPGYSQNNQTPSSPPIRWISRWGAVAMDTDIGSVGVAANLDSKNEAESNALSDCKEKGGLNCKVKNWYSNGCVVMILGKTGFNVGSKSTVNEATQSGMKICKDAGDSDCHVYYSGCSLPEPIQ